MGTTQEPRAVVPSGWFSQMTKFIAGIAVQQHQRAASCRTCAFVLKPCLIIEGVMLVRAARASKH